VERHGSATEQNRQPIAGNVARPRGTTHLRAADTPDPAQLAAVVKYTLSQRDAADTPFDVVIEGQSSGVDPGLLAPFEAVGLTWWIEKLDWFRGSVDAARERVRRGPPAPAHPTKSSRP
jgi:hypothetical protein